MQMFINIGHTLTKSKRTKFTFVFNGITSNVCALGKNKEIICIYKSNYAIIMLNSFFLFALLRNAQNLTERNANLTKREVVQIFGIIFNTKLLKYINALFLCCMLIAHFCIKWSYN